MDEDQINEYLASLARHPNAPSRSSIKHMVYGLRYYHRLLGMNKKAIALPSLKKDTKLPVILNRSELKQLFAAPTLLKQIIVLSLIYSIRIRRYGIYNPTPIRNMNLQFRTEEQIQPKGPKAKKKITPELIKQLTGFDPGLCQKCKMGRLVVVAVLSHIRSPAAHLPSLLLSKLL